MLKPPVQEGAAGPSPLDQDDADPYLRFDDLDLSSAPFPATPSSAASSGDLDFDSCLYRDILPLFTKHIHAAEFVDCPIISSMLSNQAMEQVNRKVDTEGNTSAARCLLQFLKLKDNWFGRILEALDDPDLKLREIKPRFMSVKERLERDRRKFRKVQKSSSAKGPYVTKIPIEKTRSAPLSNKSRNNKTNDSSSGRSSAPPDASPGTPNDSQSTCAEITKPKETNVYIDVDDPDCLDYVRWFHSDITRQDAEMLLEGERSGSFLIRRSMTHYTVSLRRGQTSVHIVINEQAGMNGQITYSLDKKHTRCFVSVAALVKQYMKIGMLVFPIPQPPNQV